MRFSVLNTQKLTASAAGGKRTYFSVFQEKKWAKNLCMCGFILNTHTHTHTHTHRRGLAR